MDIGVQMNKKHSYSIDAPQIFVQGSTTDGGLIMVDDVVVSEDKHSIQFPITAEMASVAGDVTCIASRNG